MMINKRLIGTVGESNRFCHDESGACGKNCAGVCMAISYFLFHFWRKEL